MTSQVGEIICWISALNNWWLALVRHWLCNSVVLSEKLTLYLESRHSGGLNDAVKMAKCLEARLSGMISAVKLA